MRYVQREEQRVGRQAGRRAGEGAHGDASNPTRVGSPRRSICSAEQGPAGAPRSSLCTARKLQKSSALVGAKRMTRARGARNERAPSPAARAIATILLGIPPLAARARRRPCAGGRPAEARWRCGRGCPRRPGDETRGAAAGGGPAGCRDSRASRRRPVPERLSPPAGAPADRPSDPSKASRAGARGGMAERRVGERAAGVAKGVPFRSKALVGERARGRSRAGCSQFVVDVSANSGPPRRHDPRAHSPRVLAFDARARALALPGRMSAAGALARGRRRRPSRRFAVPPPENVDTLGAVELGRLVDARSRRGDEAQGRARVSGARLDLDDERDGAVLRISGDAAARQRAKDYVGFILAQSDGAPSLDASAKRDESRCARAARLRRVRDGQTERAPCATWRTSSRRHVLLRRRRTRARRVRRSSRLGRARSRRLRHAPRRARALKVMSAVEHKR